MDSYRFGRCELLVTGRQLLVDGESAAIGAKAFDLLLMLVEGRGRLVTKHELLDGVWPGVVVEENNIQTQVSTLRKLLGLQAIATIPGRGYRFALPIHNQAGPDAAAAPPVVAVPERAALPALPATLHGRALDLAELLRWMPRYRLVTLMGAGGIGKTSLAIALAHAVSAQAEAAVAWVDLAPIVDGALVPSAVAQALQVPAAALGGTGDEAADALARSLAASTHLVVIDNAEHQLDAVARLARALLARAPGMRLLVTSQAPLRLDGEQIYRLAALSVPDVAASAEEAMHHGAVALFVEQAQAADRHFALTDHNLPVVLAVCRQLDGLALALKLAAARVRLLGLDGLHARLGERLGLLGGGMRDAPSRQLTLRAAFDWSHGLLSGDEQAVFRRLSLFPGDFSLELAVAVAGDDTRPDGEVIDALAALVDRSFVAVEGDAALRYRLPETARAYATDKLAAAGERDAVNARFAQAMARLMDDAYDSNWAQPDTVWIDVYAPELDNLRAALDWSARHHPVLAASLAGNAGVLFMVLGLAAEGRQRWLALVEAVNALPPSPVVARYWLEGSRLHWGVARERMQGYAMRAGAYYRSVADQRGLYLALRCAAASAEGGAGQAMVEEMLALERPEWPARLRAQRLLAEYNVVSDSGDLRRMREVLEALLRRAGEARLDIVQAIALAGLADTHLALGDANQALLWCRQLLDGPRRLFGNYVLQALATEVGAHLRLRHTEAARLAATELLELSRRRGWEWFGQQADTLAALAAQEGRFVDASRLIGYAAQQVAARGARAVNGAHDRAAAQAAVEQHLEHAAFDRELAAGARLDASQASTHVLG